MKNQPFYKKGNKTITSPGIPIRDLVHYSEIPRRRETQGKIFVNKRILSCFKRREEK